jgi:hypothetical protein
MLRIAIARPSKEIEKELANWIAFIFKRFIEAPIIPESQSWWVGTRISSSRRTTKLEEALPRLRTLQLTSTRHFKNQNLI